MINSKEPGSADKIVTPKNRGESYLQYINTYYDKNTERENMIVSIKNKNYTVLSLPDEMQNVNLEINDEIDNYNLYTGKIKDSKDLLDCIENKKEIPINAQQLITGEIRYFKIKQRRDTERGEKLFAMQVLEQMESDLPDLFNTNSRFTQTLYGLRTLTKFIDPETLLYLENIENEIKSIEDSNSSELIKDFIPLKKFIIAYKEAIKRTIPWNNLEKTKNNDTYVTYKSKILKLEKLRNKLPYYTSKTSPTENQIDYTNEDIQLVNEILSSLTSKTEVSTEKLEKLNLRKKELNELIRL